MISPRVEGRIGFKGVESGLGFLKIKSRTANAIRCKMYCLEAICNELLDNNNSDVLD